MACVEHRTYKVTEVVMAVVAAVVVYAGASDCMEKDNEIYYKKKNKNQFKISI